MIQELKNSIFFHDYRTLSGFDLSGEGNSGTFNNCIPSSQGVSLNGIDGYVSIPHSSELNLTSDFTLWALIIPNMSVGNSQQTIICKQLGGGVIPYFFNIVTTTKQLKFQVYSDGGWSVNIVTPNGSLQNNKRQLVAVNVASDGTTVSMYINGVRQTLSTDTLDKDILTNSANVRVGDYSGFSTEFLGVIKCAGAIDGALSDEEHKRLWQKMEFSYENLPTIRSVKPLDGYSFSGADVYGSLSTPIVLSHDKDFELEFIWKKGNSVTETIFGDSANGDSYFLAIVTQENILKFWDGANVASLVFTGNFEVGSLYKLKFEYSSSGALVGYRTNMQTGATDSATVNLKTSWNATWTFSVDRIGARGNLDRYLCGAIFDMKLKNDGIEYDLFSLADMNIPQYVPFNLPTGWETGYGALEVGNSFTAEYLENTPFKVNSGTHKISSEMVQVVPAKVIHTTSDGDYHVTLPDIGVNGYGKTEFWLKKHPSSNLNIMIMADKSGKSSATSQNGYLLQMVSTEIVRVYKITNGSAGSALLESATGAVPVSEWVKVTIHRTIDGQTSLYINDQLLPVSAGANPFMDNTHSICQYMNFDMDAGDRIALADIDGGHKIIKQYL